MQCPPCYYRNENVLNEHVTGLTVRAAVIENESTSEQPELRIRKHLSFINLYGSDARTWDAVRSPLETSVLDPVDK